LGVWYSQKLLGPFFYSVRTSYDYSDHKIFNNFFTGKKSLPLKVLNPSVQLTLSSIKHSIRKGLGKPEAVFLVVCDPSMNEL